MKDAFEDIHLVILQGVAFGGTALLVWFMVPFFLQLWLYVVLGPVLGAALGWLNSAKVTFDDEIRKETVVPAKGIVFGTVHVAAVTAAYYVAQRFAV